MKNFVETQFLSLVLFAFDSGQHISLWIVFWFFFPTKLLLVWLCLDHFFADKWLNWESIIDLEENVKLDPTHRGLPDAQQELKFDLCEK